ncbi:MAG: MotA/TolQ/ExbB proton channel family protein [bacterium]
MDQLYYYIPALESIRDFMELGGTVLTAIALLTLIMWALIFERLIYIRFSHQKAVSNALSIWTGRADRESWSAHMIRERLISKVSQGLEKNLSLIQTTVALCPLLGLLGTVTGMVKVFEVMALVGSSNPRSMAAGVSLATVPTMAGMVAALSGVAMSAYLRKKAENERTLLGEHMLTSNK